MNDQRPIRDDRGGPREGRGDERPRDERPRDEEPRGDGGGPDTRFLQLEMSQVMYAEAEAVARPAFRELLLEAAKERLRERFGDRITALARLAVDELLNDAEASFEIEARIQRYNEDRRPTEERLREVFAAGRAGGESRAATAEKRRAGRSRGRRGRR